jgi:DNA polymerase-3 subunit alpha
MSETDEATILSSSSYGTMRIFWSFGADPWSDLKGSHSPVRDIRLKLDGLIMSPAGLQLAPGSPSGTMETDPIGAPPFDWLLPWWNADTAGEGAVEVILAARNEKGPFLSIFDFCQRMDSGKVNRRVIEQLIKSGAFDTLHDNRASVLATLDEAMEKAQVLNRDRQSGQRNLFELLRPKQKQAASAEALVDVPGWDPRTTLQFERESIGFYISGHPLDFYEKQISGLCSVNTQSVPERREGAEVILAGVLTVTKELTTKKGDRMAFLTLEDKEGTLEVVSFSETYAQARALLESDDPVVVMGKVQHDEKGSKIIANRILSLEDAQLATVESVRIRIRSEAADREALRRLAHLLMRHSGETPALLHLVVDKKAEAVIAVSPKLAVSPSKAFFEEMDREFGVNCTEVVYKTNCAA